MKRKPYVKSELETLSIKEAMGIADVSRQTIYNWMDAKKFDFEQKTNRQVLIDKNSFMKHIENIQKGTNEMKEQTEFDKMVEENIERWETELIEEGVTFTDKKGVTMVSASPSGGRPQTWTAYAYASYLAEEELRNSLEPTNIPIAVSTDDSDDSDDSIGFHYVDFVMRGGEITINETMLIKELEDGLRVATAKYAIEVAEEFKLAVTKENCKAIAEYFNFDLFDDGTLEEELEMFLEQAE